MSIKEVLKKNPKIHAIGKKIKKTISPSQDRILNEVMKYNKERFYKYAGAFSSSEIRDAAYMTWLYHVIEKGLSMPNMKLGFGKDRIVELYGVLSDYRRMYGSKGKAYESAVSVLLEYKRVHDELEYELDKEIGELINKVAKDNSLIAPIYQRTVNKNEYFSKTENNFVAFSESRHCVRNFIPNREIPLEKIIKSIELAKNAPSACNRQPVRIHIVTEQAKIIECLEMQNGSRGFRELGNKLLIVTGDLRTVLGSQEFLDLNTNVGIFIMNLCYALL